MPRVESEVEDKKQQQAMESVGRCLQLHMGAHIGLVWKDDVDNRWVLNLTVDGVQLCLQTTD